MKIAIMTQPLGSNYGGIMQAWALQKILKGMGHEPVTINRQPDQPSTVYKTARLVYRAGMKAVGKRKAPINFENHLPDIFKNTKGFIDQKIIMSAPLYSTKQLRDDFYREQYEAVIVGSDQTWRPKYSPNIYNYFLNFLTDQPIKKIAYATSFGVDHWEYSSVQTKKCHELSKKFGAISVREQSGVDLCNEYLQCDAKVVLDPTLIISADKYLTDLKINKIKTRKQGLFTYILDPSQEKDELIYNTAQILELTPFSNQPKYSLGKGGSTQAEDYVFPKVEDWIKAFYEADFVLTDSFHGCIFSIIFNKPFFVIGNHHRGMARFKSLLKLFALEERLISESDQINISKLVAIDWNEVNIALEEQKNISAAFLAENLKN